ncbi:catechol 2,3-dioxygenase-like lactoylglutathione lyase family enzyme [Acinetobacter calcoaceticus]|uniref:Bleomycin resistance protein n=1 Tax=Acinetobacter calcoaceticus TaxID=471 RepID=A0A4R1XYR0_ACICA|nr:catechol 2,3-dioxygenase-like lactoylglutathione lyase family enzyme [Acinetobacter calcoaceticus]
MIWNKLVPELIVTDIVQSQTFWIDLLGFEVKYQRIEQQFVYLECDGVQFMLEQLQQDQWITAELNSPLGRGINFQIEVDAIDPIVQRLEQAQWPLYEAVEERWYRADQVEHGQKQFLVQDPDGYLLRLVQVLGERPV